MRQDVPEQSWQSSAIAWLLQARDLGRAKRGGRAEEEEDEVLQ